jgi:hypothetical protein
MGLGEKKRKVGTYPVQVGTYPLLKNNFLYQKELQDQKKWVRIPAGMKGTFYLYTIVPQLLLRSAQHS